MSEHTPGPWRVATDLPALAIIAECGERVVQTPNQNNRRSAGVATDSHGVSSWANARLIARAPELLARVADLEAQLADRDAEVKRLREKHKTLHRRAQEAEAAIPSYEKLIAEAPDGDGVRFVSGSLGRALLSSLCSELNAEVVELKAMLEWVVHEEPEITMTMSFPYTEYAIALDGQHVLSSNLFEGIREAMAAQGGESDG